MIDCFLSRVAAGPLLLDAAMGTRLVARGLDLRTDDPCRWNLTRPDVVHAIHQYDIDAGAEALFTNTFGANRGWLARFRQEEAVATLNRRAVELAREAAGSDRFVIGSIGPTAAGDDRWLRGQADYLLTAGVDALVLETYRCEEAVAALTVLHAVPKPILVGLFAWPDSITVTADRLITAGAAIVGANCFADLRFAAHFAAELTRVGNLPWWLKPSAGLAGDLPSTPADFARLAARLIPLRTGLLGGCCGTTDAHLRAMRATWQR